MEINKDNILSPISETLPSGIDIRHSAEFDELKELRKEEDRSVSYDIWAHPLKAANWDELRARAIDILTHKSKDLQILVWLTESFPKNFEGLYEGISLIQQFIEKFFNTFYPQEPSVRISLLEWTQKVYVERLLAIPFGQDERLTLDQWRYALFAKENQIELLRKKLEMSDKNFLMNVQKNVENCLAAIKELKTFLALHLQDGPTFNELFECFQEIFVILEIQLRPQSQTRSLTGGEAQIETQSQIESQAQRESLPFSLSEVEAPYHEKEEEKKEERQIEINEEAHKEGYQEGYQEEQELKYEEKEGQIALAKTAPIDIETDIKAKSKLDNVPPEKMDIEPEYGQKDLLLKQIESLSFMLSEAGYKPSADLVQYAAALLRK